MQTLIAFRAFEYTQENKKKREKLKIKKYCK